MSFSGKSCPFCRDFSTFLKLGPGACLIWEKKTFGLSTLGKFYAVFKNQTPILNGLKSIYEISTDQQCKAFVPLIALLKNS